MSETADLFIDNKGNHLTPDENDPRFKAHLANVAQTAMVVYRLFGIPNIESYKDYMGVVAIATNTFMLDTPEEKSAYMEHLLLKHNTNKEEPK